MEKRDMVDINASEEDFRKLYDQIAGEDDGRNDVNRNAHAENFNPEQQRQQHSNLNKEENIPWQKAFIYYLHDIVYLLATIVIVFLILFRVVVVSGTSMNNTLKDGDFLLLVSSTFYRNPKAGDIVVASKDSFEKGAPIVKRVIATEGQIVDIDFEAGVVYVDEKPLEEPYTLTKTTLYEGINFPVVVEKGCIFVLGDNRDDSKDSRSPEIGQIDTRQIVGKVFFLFFPGTNKGEEKLDFGRIGGVS